MAWFKKKDEEIETLPDLPESNAEFPRLPEIEENFSPVNEPLSYKPIEPPDNFRNLPPLPDYYDNGDQDTIKNVVGEGLQRSSFDTNQTDFINEPVREPQEFIERQYRIREPPKIREPIRTIEISPRYRLEKPIKKEKYPIYVKLDKFQESQETLHEIKEKLRELEHTLENIKEIKEREEKELEEWEREIQIIKSRLESIDSNIFNRVL